MNAKYMRRLSRAYLVVSIGIVVLAAFGALYAFISPYGNPVAGLLLIVGGLVAVLLCETIGALLVWGASVYGLLANIQRLESKQAQALHIIGNHNIDTVPIDAPALRRIKEGTVFSLSHKGTYDR